MLKKIAMAMLTLTIGFQGLAQVSTEESAVTKKASHYMGIQANGLLREVFNFGNPTTNFDNPYLLTYSVNSTKSGWGFNFGIGYDLNKFEDGDETFERNTDMTNFAMRMGFEKKTLLGKRMLVSYGADFITGKRKNVTFTANKIDFGDGRIGGSDIETNATTKEFGFGPRITFSYAVSKNFIFGTEATYYFKKADTEQNVKTGVRSFDFDPNTGERDQLVIDNDETDSTFTNKEFNLKLPLVIYLIIKL